MIPASLAHIRLLRGFCSGTSALLSACLNEKRKCGYVKEGKRIEQGDAKERKEGNLDPVEAENIHLFTCLF